jgi:hypothetical protein
MSLATVLLGNALQRDLDMVSTSRPGWLTALTTSCSTAHSFLDYLVVGYLKLERFSLGSGSARCS